MTTYQQAVKAIVDEAYRKELAQITIDLIQNNIEEELLNSEKELTSEDVGAASYDADILLEVMNQKFENDIDILTRLTKALDEWEEDMRNTNSILGLPKTS